MNKIVPFQFENVQVRTITNEQGDPWFVLRDVLDAMGSKTTVTAAIEAVNQGLGDGYVVDYPIVDALGRPQQATLVAEAAVTYLVARSNTERGRKANRWIHTEVLPSIRKTGQYKLKEIPPAPDRALLELTNLLRQRDLEARFAVVDSYHVLDSACQRKANYQIQAQTEYRANELNHINQVVLGFTARDYRSLYDIPIRQPLRHYLATLQLRAIDALQAQAALLLESDIDRSGRRSLYEAQLKQQFPAVRAFRDRQLALHEQRYAEKAWEVRLEDPRKEPSLFLPDEALRLASDAAGQAVKCLEGPVSFLLTIQ